MIATRKRESRKRNTVAVAKKRIAGTVDATAETRMGTQLSIPGSRPGVTRSSVTYSDRGAQTHTVLTGLYRHLGAREGRTASK